ncbi:MAG: type II secretion system GspH family protein [Eubacterium sp.]|nr:type II secretion system GspH family protein [Eubacterium sp.]
MKRRKNLKEGFSMVELILTIAIMAILVGALTLVVLIYLEKSKESIDLQNMDHVYKGALTVAGNEKFLESAFSNSSHLHFSDSVDAYSLEDILKEAQRNGAVDVVDGDYVLTDEAYVSDSWTVQLAEVLGPTYEGYRPKSRHAGAADEAGDTLCRMFVYVGQDGGVSVWYGPDADSIYITSNGDEAFGLGKHCQDLTQVSED